MGKTLVPRRGWGGEGWLVGSGKGEGWTHAALADEVEEHYSGSAAGVGALVV